MMKTKKSGGGIQKKRADHADVAPPVSRATNNRLDEDLWLRVRYYAMKRRISARVVVAQAITEFMARNDKREA